MVDKKDEQLEPNEVKHEDKRDVHLTEKMDEQSVHDSEEHIQHSRVATKNNTSNKVMKEILDWTKAIGIAIVLVLIIRHFLFSPFIVEGRSMEPSFESNERVIVNLLVYRFTEPKFGDVVVFNVPEQDRRFIKRIIGVPGDQIRIEGDQLFINDRLVTEPYLTSAIRESMENGVTYNGVGGRFDFPNDYVTDNVVPENMYFVLGDNRSDSTDSRIIGYIDEKELIGRADVIFWPFNKVQFVKHYN